METILLLLLLLPLLGAAAAACSGRSARQIGVAAAGLELLLVLGLFAATRGEVQAGQGPWVALKLPWIPAMGISFHLAVDGLNLLLLLLAALLTTLALGTTPASTPRLREFTVWMLLLLTGLQGVFLSQNLGLFYVFWEVMLLPAWVLVGRWGSDPSGRAGMKFFLYTLAGSLSMLLGLVALAFMFAPAGVPDLEIASLGAQLPAGEASRALLLLFALGFLVKVPVVPLHGWLPDTYEAAPAQVSAVIAGVMSKAGIYGLLKVGLGLFPFAMKAAAPWLAGLGATTLLYGAACALGGTRVRQIVAWSSLSHMGMMTLGLASLQPSGLEGACLQMFNHGLTTGGLFLVVGMLEARGVSGELARLGGLGARGAPRLAGFLLLISLASLGLPGLCSYPGELLILHGAFQLDPIWAGLGCLGVVAAGWYTLRLYQGLVQGPPGDGVPALTDLSPAELLPLLPLAALMVWIGWAPHPWAALPGGALRSMLEVLTGGAL